MKIIYTTETGLCIIHPTGEIPIEQVFAKDVPDQYKSTAHIVEDNVIPSDRTYRNAWEHIIDENSDSTKTHSIIENFGKAKEIHKNKLRSDRKPLLEAQDILYLKAQEINADTSAIVKEKQRLRDITKLVDNCTMIDELKTITIESK